MKKILSVFALTLALAIVGIVLCEFILRSVQRQAEFKIGWEYGDYTRAPKPYVMFGPGPGEYRGKNATQKTGKDFRVFILGGSTVFVGEPPFAELLEQKLRSAYGSHIQIFNYGVISQNSTQELIRLVSEISLLSPDLIIAYDGGNDIMDPFYWDPRPGYTYNFMAYENNPLFNPAIKDYPFWSMLGLGSQFLRNIFFSYYQKKFFNLEQLRMQSNYLSVDWKQKISGSYTQNILKMHLSANAFGSKFVSFFQPLLFYKQTLDSTEKKLPSNTPEALTYAEEMREIIRANLKELSKLHPQLLTHDLSTVFENQEKAIFQDYIHISQDGNEIISQKMLDQIQKLRLVK